MASPVKLTWDERHSTLITLFKVMVDKVSHQTIIWANVDPGSCFPVYCLDVKHIVFVHFITFLVLI